ncbi:DivIVA domain-containing protein [Micromonospora sp. CPCC 206061]|uniref:DivIVA domain-containing protein n=1 Tax=Micromonospora sp. CPCC 206061 TaxID=3122410 RepID=UPI002FF4220F
MSEPLEQMAVAAADPAAQQHQALQVLTLAQRTAEEHVASARREVDRIRAEAQASADQIIREAQANAQGLHQEAEKALSAAHASAAQIARDAQARFDKAQHEAETILSEARTKADDMAKHAQASADELKHQAEQKYEDVVGSLAARREALQRQIEALEGFDQEYRTRLTTFMQNQLRALWVDQPQVNAEAIEPPADHPDPDLTPAGALPAQRTSAPA